MERKSFRIYVLEFLQIIFLLLACMYNKIFTKSVISMVLLVFMVVTVVFFKNNKVKSIRSKQITILMALSGIIFVVIKYILGVFLGFYNSTVTLSKWSVINYIMPYIVIIVSTEIMRKRVVLYTSKKDILSRLLFLSAMVLLDISLLSDVTSLGTLKEWFDFVAGILFPSIATNLLYNFVARNFREEVGIIIYRIITVMYIYFIPITPDLEILLETLLNLVVPCVIYAVLTSYLNKKNEFSVPKEKIEKILTIILGAVAVTVVMLVSCKFRYCVIVIGSGSMTGTIDKGDVIVYEAYNEKMEIRKGDILVFKDEGRKIVHRVIDKRILKGNEIYYTKGDANQQEDEGYVTKDNVVGIYRLRVPYIGQIALSLNKIFD